MNTKLCLGIFLLAAAMLRAQTNDLTALLQQGLFEEQASRNLDAAIADYQSLAAQFDKDRQLAATAVFRLGECYRAQGRTNEAAAQYQRILRDFSDQQTLATLSRQDLTGMGFPQTVAGKTTGNPGAGAISAEAGFLATQISGLEKLKSDPEEQARGVLAIFPDEVLKKMLVNLPKLQEQEARLKANPQMTYTELSNGYGYRIAIGPDLSEVERHGTNLLTDAGWELRKQVSWIEERVNFTLGIQKARLKVLQAATGAEVTHDAGQSNATSMITGEEDREIQRIQTMIQNSPDLINAPGEGGNTPLTQAASKGWLKVATYLIEHGADVNAGGIPPLNCAAMAGNRAMTELLLSRGANVSSKGGSQDQTPLQIAVEKKFQAVAEVLLANKADVNAQDKHGDSPLGSAVWNGQAKIIQMLLAAGANVNVENNQGRTPLSFAAERGSPEIVKLFLAAKADPNGGRLDAPLLAAIHAKDVVSVELLLQAGAKPNAKGEDDWQPSILGAYGRPVGRGWETAIKLAVSSGQLPMVKLLLKFKADPNIAQTDGRSVLFGALSDTTMLAALLDAGGKADARYPNEPFGWTLLACAVSETNLTAVQLLLKFKADPNDSQIDGRSIIFRALADTNILEALLDAGAKVDPVTPDETEWTPLSAAANQKNVAAMEILLKHGANPNFHNRNGVTPLHWAAYGHADSKVLKLLLEAKANPNVRSSNGKTPLDELKGNQNNDNSRGIPTVRAFTVNSTPGGRLAYQWSAGNPDANSPETPGTNIIALLHQYGALDELPDFTRIRITRQGLTQPLEVFRRGASLTNHFTLLETAMRFYSVNQVVLPGQAWQAAWSAMPFPDFGRIIIRRPSATLGGKDQEIKVSLLNSSNVVDCAHDVPVEFGDVIEIPESVHALNAGMPNPVQEMETASPLPQGATFAERLQSITSQSRGGINPYQTAKLCLQKTVQLVVAGETTTFKVNSWKEGFLSWALQKTEARSVLRSSSDLSRVTVTRKTGNSGKPTVFTVDVSGSSPNNDDLWLEEGDVITVPDKT